jgi:hypothetical protein
MFWLEIAMFIRQEITANKVEHIYSILKDSDICESSESE